MRGVPHPGVCAGALPLGPVAHLHVAAAARDVAAAAGQHLLQEVQGLAFLLALLIRHLILSF